MIKWLAILTMLGRTDLNRTGSILLSKHLAHCSRRRARIDHKGLDQPAMNFLPWRSHQYLWKNREAKAEWTWATQAKGPHGTCEFKRPAASRRRGQKRHTRPLNHLSDCS
jgi:hypothetical protein